MYEFLVVASKLIMSQLLKMNLFLLCSDQYLFHWPMMSWIPAVIIRVGGFFLIQILYLVEKN